MLDVPLSDPLILHQVFFLVLVMRQGVVSALHPLQKGEVGIPDGVAKHKRTNSCGVGLECQRNHVEHQSNVFGVFPGNPRWLDTWLHIDEGFPSLAF